ncbi:hypothetical protein [Anaeromicropila herbilytica]|uniref:Fibronectin type-III domain-containing protein n=1 Tax=Anaeromicropila herbilytica TaxID=2785025 RepID=A0A7R7EP17_9FIRM|nr:hypothetical protein [Anaeromicropila herbilytica]BCN32090.1 hypothetical protein bsdtb5_33850 [Anaeromicropila herbilytica]
MKIIKRLTTFIVICAIAITSFSSVSLAAIGENSLTDSETGWQRYDDNNSNIVYYGNWKTDNVVGNYNSTAHYANSVNSGYKFKFYGTKLRLIVGTASSQSTNVAVKIDSKIFTYNSFSTDIERCKQKFEQLDLGLGYHSVEVVSLIDNKDIQIDAIDVDDTGYLINPFELKATSGEKEVELSWNTFDDRVTGYNVYRSDKSGGPYTAPLNTNPITSTTYTDSSAKNVSTYYYIVRAVMNGIESSNSNEVCATPKSESVYTGNKAILEITMTNGTIKEYDLTMNEIDKFLTWYDNRSDGVGKSYYRIIKRSNVKPFNSRYEYLQFDKIYSFEVKEYNDK